MQGQGCSAKESVNVDSSRWIPKSVDVGWQVNVAVSAHVSERGTQSTLMVRWLLRVVFGWRATTVDNDIMSGSPLS